MRHCASIHVSKINAMARMFTISFTYNNQQYNALVTVQTTALFHEYTLCNLDAALLSLLPGNKIISASPQQFDFLHASEKNSQSLMSSIIKAVTVHLQAVNS